MRLINAKTLVEDEEIKFKLFPNYDETPKYAILSHRWGNNELTFQQACDPTDAGVDFEIEGHKKVKEAATKAMEYQLEWIWCDTCCIDKLSSAELTEAINSMFRWYQDSTLCIVYLADVSTGDITKSEWFERAWTLQELIAPPKLMFFNKDWDFICNKQQRLDEIERRTRIDKVVLDEGFSELKKRSVAQRMSWAADRVASRIEDIAYSLLGLFDVNIPMMYGEREKAFIRLQEEIIKREADQTIFMWFPERGTNSEKVANSLFAPSPKSFARCSALRHDLKDRKPFAINNLGLEIDVLLRPYDQDRYIAYLPIKSSITPKPTCLKLGVLPETSLLFLEMASLQAPRENRGPQVVKARRVTILRDHVVQRTTKQALYGFRFSGLRHNLTLVNGWDREQKWDTGQWTEEPFPDTYRYQIQQGATGSIAVLTLNVDEDAFLIQLAYDFDFVPRCSVTKLRMDLREHFHRRTGFNDSHINWIYDDTNWDDKVRYVDRYDPVTKSWAVKAKPIDYTYFKAEVPITITKSLKRPHFQISVIFVKEDLRDDPKLSTAWRFGIDSNLSVSELDDDGVVSIADLRVQELDESMVTIREGYSQPEGLKRPSGSALDPIERLSKRIDTYPL